MVCLVVKFIFHLSFKCFDKGVWCLHQQRNKREFRARSRFEKRIFFTKFSLLRWFGCAVSSQENVGKPTKAAINVPCPLG